MYEDIKCQEDTHSLYLWLTYLQACNKCSKRPDLQSNWNLNRQQDWDNFDPFLKQASQFRWKNLVYILELHLMDPKCNHIQTCIQEMSCIADLLLEKAHKYLNFDCNTFQWHIIYDLCNFLQSLRLKQCKLLDYSWLSSIKNCLYKQILGANLYFRKEDWWAD